MSVNLQNKEVLIIMPFYFSYQNTIKNEIIKCGGKPYFIDEDFDQDNFFDHLEYVYLKNKRNALSDKYYEKAMENLNLPNHLDYVLIIKGRTITENKLKFLKDKYSSAKFIMYQWDSVKKAKCALLIAKFCTQKYTFDPVDSKKYGWGYRPLFFDPINCSPKKKKKYDFVFICSLHSQRILVYEKLKEICLKSKKTLYKHIYCEKWSYIRQKWLHRNDSYDLATSDVSFKSLSLNETNRIYDESFCIVDYKFPEQDGLTMRSIEALGHKCKLLTNNENIINEPFYDSKNICVYKLNDFFIPKDFLREPYYEIDDAILKKYTIEGWIEDIFL